MASARELIEGAHTTWNARDLQGYRDLGAPALEMDRVDFMTQLGLMPEPAAAGA